MIDLIKHSIVTAKSSSLLEQNKYIIAVDLTLSKPQIKRLVEGLFETTVISVNTQRPPRKRNLGQFKGFKSSYKKAIVTLKEEKPKPGN